MDSEGFKVVPALQQPLSVQYGLELLVGTPVPKYGVHGMGQTPSLRVNQPKNQVSPKIQIVLVWHRYLQACIVSIAGQLLFLIVGQGYRQRVLHNPTQRAQAMGMQWVPRENAA